MPALADGDQSRKHACKPQLRFRRHLRSWYSKALLQVFLVSYQNIHILDDAPEHFHVNLMSLCIFPFAARPMILEMLGMDQRGFDQFIARRRQDLTAFFLGALRP